MFRQCILIVLSLAGFSANNCRFDVKLEQNLVNEGFHRNITYKIVFASHLNKHLYEDCIVGLDQWLPDGVFANPDELGDLKRAQKLSIIPGNRVNVELPAEKSQSTSVYIISKLVGGQASTWLPVHARYHYASAKGGFAYNRIVPPRVFLRCPDQRLDQCDEVSYTMTFLCNDSSRERCSWKQIPTTVVTDELFLEVPIGNTSSYHLVTVVTAFVVVTGSLYLLKTLHEYNIYKKAL